MGKRKSIYLDGLAHANPVPNACCIGNLLLSGIITGRDPKTGEMPDRLDEQCANMFANMKAVVETAGGTVDDILKVTLWLKDRSQRDPANVEWLKMFPDAQSRPARQAMETVMPGNALIHCDIVAVMSDAPGRDA